MTKDEALKQALIALEDLQSLDSQDVWLDRWSEAITAIKEALAQPPLPVQEPKRAMHTKYRELYDSVGYMVCEVGRAGTIDPRNPLVTSVMCALHRIDDGTWIDPAKTPGIESPPLPVQRQPRTNELSRLLFAVGQAVENGAAPFDIEDAYEDYMR